MKNIYATTPFQEASQEFDQAVALMSEEELDLHPYVLTYRSNADYKLGNYSRVIQDTEIALQSKHLTDYERLACGSRRSGAFTVSVKFENPLQTP